MNGKDYRPEVVRRLAEPTGYIPEGGVWKREEREAFRPETCAAARTVAALIRALEDTTEALADITERWEANWAIGREKAKNARALLAEVKK